MRERTNRVPDSFSCPWCFDVHDAVTGLNHDEKPKAGDFTVCIRCGGIARFTADLRLRQAERKELRQLPRETYELLLGAQRAVRLLALRALRR